MIVCRGAQHNLFCNLLIFNNNIYQYAPSLSSLVDQNYPNKNKDVLLFCYIHIHRVKLFFFLREREREREQHSHIACYLNLKEVVCIKICDLNAGLLSTTTQVEKLISDITPDCTLGIQVAFPILSIFLCFCLICFTLMICLFVLH